VERNLCVLFDFDNIAKGSRQEGLGEFDVRVVMRRLKDLGRILVARAYCDWDRWQRHKTRLAEQGVTMVELPATGHGDKNRGDIALVVDAMEIAFNREYLDTFVIVSGDSDFTPLVTRLKELNRRVIGIGTRGSTSRLIANVCDEFMFYDTLVRATKVTPVSTPDNEDDDDDDGASAGAKPKLDMAFNLLVETLQNVQRDEGGPVHASVLKTSMKRKLPTFDEDDFGFSTFARFLERAQAEGLVSLRRDDRAGGFRVELRNDRASAEPEAGPSSAPSSSTPDAAALPAEAPAESPPQRRLPRVVVEALDALVAEGLDIGLAVERQPILEALVAACNDRIAKSRRLAVQYLQGDLVQGGYDPEAVRAVLGSLVRVGAILHPDGEPVRAPTAPIQPPASAAELNALLEERALEILGSKRLRVGPLIRRSIFAEETAAAQPDTSAPAEMPSTMESTGDHDSACPSAMVVDADTNDTNIITDVSHVSPGDVPPSADEVPSAAAPSADAPRTRSPRKRAPRKKKSQVTPE